MRGVSGSLHFDHSNPNYTVDGVLTIYSKERGRQDHGCADCYWSGGIQVCGYHTEPNCGGRRIYYDGHPAIDYAFPLTTPIAAAAPGTAYRRAILGSAVVIDHGGSYWSKYGHVDPGSRIADGTQVERGRQIALSSNTGTGAAHLHFEVRYLGEYGDVVDPYGWWGEWYEDPWNRPWGHTHDWWRSRDPIPMGYRDQNGVNHGPFQVTGAIGDKWEALDGEPGSPLEDRHWCAPYGECQSFEIRIHSLGLQHGHLLCLLRDAYPSGFLQRHCKLEHHAIHSEHQRHINAGERVFSGKQPCGGFAHPSDVAY